MKLAKICVLVAVTASFARGEWDELKDAAGRVVEVVVDFKTENFRVDAQGTAFFVARTLVDGEEVGFSAELSKATEAKVGVLFQKDTILVMRSGLAVKSIGPATSRLEQRLNRLLKAPDGDVHVVGLYSAMSPLTAASIVSPALIQARDVGLTFDADGKQVGGECWAVDLLIDGPLGRATIHFHRNGGFGGKAEADRAREEWLKARTTAVQTKV